MYLHIIIECDVEPDQQQIQLLKSKSFSMLLRWADKTCLSITPRGIYKTNQHPPMQLNYKTVHDALIKNESLFKAHDRGTKLSRGIKPDNKIV